MSKKNNMGLIVMGILSLLFYGLAIYVGGWLMFIGGLVDIIEVFKADTVEAMKLAWGVGKVCLASFVSAIFVGLGNICFVMGVGEL